MYVENFSLMGWPISSVVGPARIHTCTVCTCTCDLFTKGIKAKYKVGSDRFSEEGHVRVHV